MVSSIFDPSLARAIPYIPVRVVLGMEQSWEPGRTGRGPRLGANAQYVQLTGRHRDSTSQGPEAILRVVLVYAPRCVETLTC